MKSVRLRIVVCLVKYSFSKFFKLMYDYIDLVILCEIV